MVYRTALRYTGSRPDAEDITHNVFLKIKRSFGSFRKGSSVFTWIYRITVNESINLIRKNRSSFYIEFDEEINSAGQSSDTMKNLENRDTLRNILKKTDRITAMCAVMIYFEGMKQEEAAETLGISRRNLNNRLARLKEKAKKK